ncbi:MAG: protein kinase [Bacteroidales bacterium]|jgi:serine/threonine protein kinase|nr:protein kinase [Bacteroidales bacterium]
MTLEQNTLFHSRYLLIKLLGRGGFSEVWLVEDTKVINKKMALKIYAPYMGLDDDGVRLFSAEFELVFDLNHSHLLRPAHFDVFNRSPYLVLPFCEKGSANKLAGKITEDQAWHFLHDVAAGLAFLHEQDPPIIHQDIKPDNVLMDNSGHFLITDFGISTKARSTLRKSMEKNQKTSSGTIAYMAPERFGKNNEPIKASDVWALGATLFELMTGGATFGEHGGLVQKNGAEIPNFKGVWSDDLQKIVSLCLELEPWDRPMATQIVEWTEKYFRGECVFSKEKRCLKCGKIITTQSKFCIYCGTVQIVRMIRCKSCQKEIEISTRFCPYCRTQNNV